MTRGLVAGVLWGSVFAVVALWLVSQLGGMVALLSTPPEDVAVAAPLENAPAPAPEAEVSPQAPLAAAGPATDPSRQKTALANSNRDVVPQADTQPAEVPQTTLVENEAREPSRETASSDVPEIEATVNATLQVPRVSESLAQPVSEADPQIATALPVPQNPSPKPTSPDAPTPSAQNENAPATHDNTPIDAAPLVVFEPVQPVAPANETAPESGVAPPVSDFSQPVVVETPQVVEPTVPAEPATAATDTARNDDQTTPKPPVNHTNGFKSNVRTNRLATIGDDAASDPTPASANEIDVGVEGRAIERFAQSFDNPNNRPMMAILLLVDPQNPDLTSLRDPLPFPVSYVIDASQDNAPDIMRVVRSAGFEVVAQAPLPPHAAPKDVEVAFQTYLAAVPEAVAVMDVPSGEFQSGRNVATQVAQVLAASGHGMITYARGLNSATQVAERENVPVALVYRVFDNDGQDNAAIKRFLDQAAFRAGQRSGVILVGHDRPDTIAALLEWGLGNRASTVALAPVSAALLAK